MMVCSSTPGVGTRQSYIITPNGIHFSLHVALLSLVYSDGSSCVPFDQVSKQALYFVHLSFKTAA